MAPGRLDPSTENVTSCTMCFYTLILFIATLRIHARDTLCARASLLLVFYSVAKFANEHYINDMYALTEDAEL